jgi:peptidylprolyl isomerase
MSDRNRTTQRPHTPVRKPGSSSHSQALIGGVVGALVVAVVVAVFVAIRLSGPDDKPAAASTQAPAAGQASSPAAPQPPTAAEPQPGAELPPGTDPQLATRPVVGKGSGALTALVVTPLVKGTGPAVQPRQTILVNYVGVSYTTGQPFDASWDRGQPFPVQIGVGGVIPGWDQGLVGVSVGSRVQLDIPANLAYGDKPTRPGAPAGPLRFVVDVLAVQPG